MKFLLRRKLNNLNALLKKGGTIILGEEYFFSGFREGKGGKIFMISCLDDELSKAAKYLSRKGIKFEIIGDEPRRYMFSKN